MSVISGTISALNQRKSANDSNAEVRKQRELALRMFQESRGSTGSAVLPTYGGDFEKALFQGARGVYEADLAAQGTPAEQLARYQADADRFRPAFDQGSDFIDSIYSGALGREQLAEAAPVQTARTALARSKKQGILDDITARLGALDAANARKGFLGSGSAAQGAAVRQTAPLYQQAAGAGALATFQNAQQTQAIQESNRQLKLNSLGLPASRAQQSIALRQAPLQGAVQNQLTAQKPFGMFNIGTAAFRPDTNALQPVPNSSAIIATGIGAAGNQIGQYFANQQQAKSIQNAYGQPSYNPYSSAGLDASLYSQPYASSAASSAAAGGELAALEEMYSY